ncbi:BRCA1-associated protein [Amylostereum chailletii]|nr:BRCA1-associated protein [Amylostereum chailletii]
MKAYHIRISLDPKPVLSRSHPQPSDDFTPTSIWQHLPSHPPKHKRTRSAYKLPYTPQPPSSTHGDYRYGNIRVDWVDFDNMSTMVKEKGQLARGTAIASFTSHTRTKSGSTNLPEGVVHVYREAAKNPSLDPESSSSADAHRVLVDGADTEGIMLGVLAVPSWMTPSDFLAFVAPAQEGMAHLRMIRDSAPNRSIVLIKFRKEEDALEFAEAYNGKNFNSMEPETCHVVRVASVSIDTDDFLSLSIARLGTAQAPAYELPTCPVCLERMDSAVTGLVTVPCSHTFHCTCLSKWGDSRCPVCRYSQTLRTSHPTSSTRPSVPIPFADPSTPAMSTCADCASTTNLWICLICGNIGCGRYGAAHAHAHYTKTTHLYALELETQRTWDYASDQYVHRLIQNKADGKLVELPSASMASSATSSTSNGAGGPSAADALTAEKIEAIGIEYSYLLSSQLDTQRAYYEEQQRALQARVDELARAVAALGDASAREREARGRAEAEAARSAELERDRVRAEKKAEKLAELARRLEKELKDERAVGAGLLKNLEAARARAEAADSERTKFTQHVKELEDQVRDVMFFLEARTKIEEGDGAVAEAAGGSIEVATPPPNPLQPGGKKKKKR